MQWFWSFIITLTACSPASHEIRVVSDTTDGSSYVTLSQELLIGMRDQKDVSSIINRYASIDLDDLIKTLDTQEEKLAFWVNTYNGFIQYLLVKDPVLYDDRSAFFTKDRFTIAGQEMSFDRVEHGIIRDSRVKYGLGYIKKWFSPKYERQLRIKKRDARIHFALNCGAITCPPVAVYNARHVDQQLNTITERYLSDHTTIEGRTVTTSPLFSWFRGDFGGKKGIKKMLQKYNVTSTADVDLKFGDYDWTLLTGNYVDI